MNTTVFKLDDVGEKHNVVIDSNTGLSVVIPVYNSEGIILELHKRLTNELNSPVRDYELIFVASSQHVLVQKKWIRAQDFRNKILITFLIDRSRLNIFS